LSKKIKPKKGKILDPNGKQIGEHDGIYYYTVGQRLGPRYGFELERKNERTGKMEKWYVAKKDIRKNIITAAPEGHPLLEKDKIIIKEFHLIAENEKEFLKEITKSPKKIFSRIRQVGELIPSKIEYKNKKIIVTLNRPLTGISEGQAVVIYQKTKCLGGGVISF